MLRSLMTLLNKAMPVLLLLFVILAALQLFLLSPVTGQKFLSLYEPLIDHGRTLFLPAASFFLLFVLIGYGYELSSNRLAKRGLQRRKGFFVRMLDSFTCRRNVNETLTRTYEETRLDAGEFAAALRARVIGQDPVCEDVAQQIKLRLATRKRNRPVSLFLFLGPSGTGKKFLARQIARQLDRPCFCLKKTDAMQTGQSLSARIEAISKETPRAVLIIQNCLALSVQDWAQISGLWLNHTNSGTHLQNMMIIFTETLPSDLLPSTSNAQSGITPEERRMMGNKSAHSLHIQPDLINQCDRIFLFKPLLQNDLAQVSAMALEELICDYGLNVETGGIAPALIQPFIEQQRNPNLTSHEIVRLIEDQIGDSLITLRQQGITTIRLIRRENGERGCLMVQKASPAQERLTPATLRG